MKRKRNFKSIAVECLLKSDLRNGEEHTLVKRSLNEMHLVGRLADRYKITFSTGPFDARACASFSVDFHTKCGVRSIS